MHRTTASCGSHFYTFQRAPASHHSPLITRLKLVKNVSGRLAQSVIQQCKIKAVWFTPKQNNSTWKVSEPGLRREVVQGEQLSTTNNASWILTFFPFCVVTRAEYWGTWSPRLTTVCDTQAYAMQATEADYIQHPTDLPKMKEKKGTPSWEKKKKMNIWSSDASWPNSCSCVRGWQRQQLLRLAYIGALGEIVVVIRLDGIEDLPVQPEGREDLQQQNCGKSERFGAS